jgi:hypothetical protein
MGILCSDPGHGRAADGEPVAKDSSASEADSESDVVYEFSTNRAVIEQAKGMLMFVYGIEADAAFDILREQSQQHNVKLRLIAMQVSKDLVQLSRTSSPRRRIEHDLLLRSAHQRITDAATRQNDTEAGISCR